MITIEKISIFYLITLFIIYIILHVAIGYKKDKLEKLYSLNNDKYKKEFTLWNKIFIWFPYVYVVCLIILLLGF